MRLKATGVKNKFSTLKRSMFIRERDFPLLKGKAAELKHFLRPLLGAFVNFMDAADEIDKRIKTLLTVSVEMEDILEVNKDRFKFDRDVSARFEQCTHAFHQLNTALANRFHPEGVLLFNHTIKFHALLHIGLISRFMNPRLAWCYAGEDFMMKVRKVAQSSYSGTPPEKVAPKALNKYAHGLGMHLATDVWQR